VCCCACWFVGGGVCGCLSGFGADFGCVYVGVYVVVFGFYGCFCVWWVF